MAHADSDDDAYIAAIQSVGTPTDSPATNTAYGKGLCARLPEVGFDALVAAVHHDNLSASITMHQSALIIGAAISNYCIVEVDMLPKSLAY